jgi:antitoxin component HigA of HigAB toxin-antitoxin module
MSIEAMKQALEALIDLTNEMIDQDFVNQGMDAITALRTAIAEAEKSNIKQVIHLYDEPPAAPVQEADAYGHAKRLAEAIWQKHYKATAPQWKPFDDLIGVLTQIDNMTAGLTAQPAQRKPLTDEQIESGRRVLSCFDFDLFMAGARFAEAAHGIKEKNT